MSELSFNDHPKMRELVRRMKVLLNHQHLFTNLDGLQVWENGNHISIRGVSAYQMAGVSEGTLQSALQASGNLTAELRNDDEGYRYCNIYPVNKDWNWEKIIDEVADMDMSRYVRPNETHRRG